jgi:excisionase family DNA binding protein
MTVAEVAKLLRFSDETIHRKCREGDLDYIEVLGNKRFRRDYIETLIGGAVPARAA